MKKAIKRRESLQATGDVPLSPVHATTAIQQTKRVLRLAVRLSGQCLLLYSLFTASSQMVQALHLPLPASLVGILLLLLLLLIGVIKPQDLAEVSDLVSKHLAFFFVPLVIVGVMSWFPVLTSFGLILAVALIGSAVVGLIATGLVAQAFLPKNSPKRRALLMHWLKTRRHVAITPCDGGDFPSPATGFKRRVPTTWLDWQRRRTLLANYSVRRSKRRRG